METFANRLKTLMNEVPISAPELASKLGFYDSSSINKWLRGGKGMLLTTAIELANLLGCSLDYLFGRSDINKSFEIKDCPPFAIQFKNLLKALKVSQIELVNNKLVSYGSYNSWFNKKQQPHIESVIRLADYLHVTMDYLVGRED